MPPNPHNLNRQAFLGFLRGLPWVSRETVVLFDQYHDLLIHWNKKINLISSTADGAIWHRHFLDSAQLATHLPHPPEAGPGMDVGSGAGFPGLVLALLGYRVSLIERDQRKAAFLREAIRLTGVQAELIAGPIESLYESSQRRPCWITARALAPLPVLLSLAKPLAEKETKLLLLKGKNCEQEITEAKREWAFTLQKHPSITDANASLLHVTGLCKKELSGTQRHD